MSKLCLYLFGAPRLEKDGAAVTTDTRKAIALLAYLAVTGRPHTRDALATLLWGDSDQQHARGALRRTLSVLRSAVGEGVLNAADDTIGLGPGLWCDVTAFRAELGKAGQSSGGAASQLPALVAAVTHNTGPFMAGFSLRDSPDFEEWQFLEGEALDRELAAALDRLARDLADQGDTPAALAHARRLLSLDPLNEEAHRLLMQLYAISGAQGSALRQYRECVRVLDQELGVTPLAETAELYQAIREKALVRPAPRAATASVAERLAEAAAAGPVSPRAGRPWSLVGRAREWTTLTRAYGRDAQGGYCLALEGEAGIGKTRLAEDFLAHARSRGAAVVGARCYEGESGVAYGAITGALRALIGESGCQERLAQMPAFALSEAARLLPELAARAPAAAPLGQDPGAAARFLEGLRQFLTGLCTGTAPTVLFFDDLHWADAASLDFLVYLVRRLVGQPLFVLLSWRPDGSPQVEQLRALLVDAMRAGRGGLLALRRLSLADVLELASAVGGEGRSLPDGLAGRVYHESEGVPLFVVAYLEAAYLEAAREGAIPGAPDPPREVRDLPRGVRDLLAARLRGLGETERQLLQAAAVLGRSFDVDVLQAISGRTAEETLGSLDRLAARGLIHELAGTGPVLLYDFDHEKLRSLIYEETSLARRRLLHERAGRGLVAAGSRRRAAEAFAAQAAHHFEEAGLAEEAAAQHLVAARHAAQIFANVDALAHYRSALGLGHADVALIHEAIGDLVTLGGDYGVALASYEAAAAALPPGSSHAPAIEHKLANLHARLGNWEAAESYFVAADGALMGDCDGDRASLYADWSLACHQQGAVDRAAALAGRALDCAERTGDRRALAQAHNIAGVLGRARGDFRAAIASLERSCELAEALGDPGVRAAALNNLALALGAAGDFSRAAPLLQEALAACSRQGDRHREAALRNNLADLLHAAGREEEAMAELKAAVALFAEVGMQAGEARPEIWKLTEW